GNASMSGCRHRADGCSPPSGLTATTQLPLAKAFLTDTSSATPSGFPLSDIEAGRSESGWASGASAEAVSDFSSGRPTDERALSGQTDLQPRVANATQPAKSIPAWRENASIFTGKSFCQV